MLKTGVQSSERSSNTTIANFVRLRAKNSYKLSNKSAPELVQCLAQTDKNDNIFFTSSETESTTGSEKQISISSLEKAGRLNKEPKQELFWQCKGQKKANFWSRIHGFSFK